eukprot:c5770_g1_i1 orf=2-154(+)
MGPKGYIQFAIYIPLWVPEGKMKLRGKEVYCIINTTFTSSSWGGVARFIG